jgi:hypothetical protein
MHSSGACLPSLKGLRVTRTRRRSQHLLHRRCWAGARCAGAPALARPPA